MSQELEDYSTDDVTPLPAGDGYVRQGPDPQLQDWWDHLTPSCREELCGLHPGDVLSRPTTSALPPPG